MSSNQPQISSLFSLNSDGFVTISGHLCLEARARAGGLCEHKSIVRVLLDREGPASAKAYTEAAIRTVETVNAMSEDLARAYYELADEDTILHLQPLGLYGGFWVMAMMGLFDRPGRKFSIEERKATS